MIAFSSCVILKDLIMWFISDSGPQLGSLC